MTVDFASHIQRANNLANLEKASRAYSFANFSSQNASPSIFGFGSAGAPAQFSASHFSAPQGLHDGKSSSGGSLFDIMRAARKKCFEKIASFTSSIKTTSGAAASTVGATASSAVSATSVTIANASKGASALINSALGEIGVKGAKSDRVAQYRGSKNNNPWCASFVSWNMKQTFGANNPLKHSEAVQGIWDQAKAAGVYSAKENYTPKPGDIIIFKSAGASHTGLVKEVKDGKVYTVEGNSSDKVAERSYALNNKTITGYAKTDEWVAKKTGTMA